MPSALISFTNPSFQSCNTKSKQQQEQVWDFLLLYFGFSLLKKYYYLNISSKLSMPRVYSKIFIEYRFWVNRGLFHFFSQFQWYFTFKTSFFPTLHSKNHYLQRDDVNYLNKTKKKSSRTPLILLCGSCAANQMHTQSFNKTSMLVLILLTAAYCNTGTQLTLSIISPVFPSASVR